MKHETGWAIAGQYGLYIGWHPVRREMIAQHVKDIHGASHGFCLSGKLNAAQQEAWGKCKNVGDRAVKVRLSYSPS